MLSFMALAYRGYSAERLQPLLDNTESRQRHLFNAYIVERMRDATRIGTIERTVHPKQTLDWLCFLARTLDGQGLQQYFIDEMQPVSWLAERQLWVYRLILGLVFGAVMGSVFGIFVGVVNGAANGIVVGIVFGVSIGIGYGRAGKKIARLESTQWRRPTIQNIVKSLFTCSES